MISPSTECASTPVHGARNSNSLVGGLGEAWLKLVKETVENGVCSDGECREILEARVSFRAETDGDALIARFGDQTMVANMQKVFFGDGANALGHSYAKLMRGPDGLNDLSDLIALLRAERHSKRAVLTLCGTGHGKVPCVNAAQFLVRGGAVRTIYFARGQDAFKKFYADALCLAAMTRKVAGALDLPTSGVSGFIGSSHIYNADRLAVDEFLARGAELLGDVAARGAV